MQSIKPASFARSRGFTLIEAMVGLVVLSVGLLGVAALQLSSLRANTSASFRSQATFLAYDIADRMRANRPAALSGAYNIAFGEETAEAPTTRAENDLKDWLKRISDSLPSGATAQVQSLDPSIFAISIRWDDRHGDIGATDGNGETTFELRVGI